MRFGEVLQGKEGLSVPQGPCIMHFFTVSCKTGSSLVLGISAVGEININLFSYSVQYFSSMNTFILKKVYCEKKLLAHCSVEISTGPASTI